MLQAPLSIFPALNSAQVDDIIPIVSVSPSKKSYTITVGKLFESLDTSYTSSYLLTGSFNTLSRSFVLNNITSSMSVATASHALNMPDRLPPTEHTHSVDDVFDLSLIGRNISTAVNVTSARNILELGSLSTQNGTLSPSHLTLNSTFLQPNSGLTFVHNSGSIESSLYIGYNYLGNGAPFTLGTYSVSDGYIEHIRFNANGDLNISSLNVSVPNISILNINEIAAGTGVTVDGTLIKDNIFYGTASHLLGGYVVAVDHGTVITASGALTRETSSYSIKAATASYIAGNDLWINPTTITSTYNINFTSGSIISASVSSATTIALTFSNTVSLKPYTLLLYAAGQNTTISLPTPCWTTGTAATTVINSGKTKEFNLLHDGSVWRYDISGEMTYLT